MSVWTRIGRSLGFRNQRDLVMSPPQFGVRYLPVFEAGTTLTVEEALRVSVVWGCMDVLVRSIAPRPWNVYEVNGRVRTLRPDDSLAYLLNTRPNPEMTAIALREALQYSAIGFGNGYAEIVPDNANRPKELWPIEPERVLPWRKENTDDLGQAGELGYRVTQYNGGTAWVPARRIFHLRGPSSTVGGVGSNLLYLAARAIAISASAQQFSATYFRNGSVLTGVLETDKKVVDQRTADLIRAQWEERYAGPQNSGKPLVLPDGLKWREIAGDPNKSQLLETRRFQIAEVARYFGVPLQKLQESQSSQGYGTNIEQLGIEFVRDTLRPWAERFEQEADFKLLPGRAPWRETKLDLSELVSGDLKSQVEAAVKAVEGGILTINEARERFGWNNIGSDGDVHFLPSTAKPIEQILEPPEPASVAPRTAPAMPAEDGEMVASRSIVREAAAELFAGPLDRYARILHNRSSDLKRRSPETLDANLASERDRQRPRLIDECAGAIGLLRAHAGLAREVSPDLLSMADAVEQGEPPKLAAQRLVSKLMEATA